MSTLPESHQYAVATILYRAYSGQAQHNSGLDQMFPIHWRYKGRAFRSAAAFIAANARLGYFVAELPEIIGRSARGYTLTEKAKLLCAGYLSLSFSIEDAEMPYAERGLVTADGAVFRMPAKAIRSRMSTGSDSRFTSATLKAAVEVDGDTLHQFHNAANAWLHSKPIPEGFDWLAIVYETIANGIGPNCGSQFARQRARRGIVQASMMLDLSKRTRAPGYVVPCIYAERPSGRLYAEGPLTLQGCVREVRKAALKGCYDVDVENCHYTLLAQIAARLGGSTPTIDSYVQRKKEIRLQLATDIQLSVSDVKKLLNALIYGASLTASRISRRGLQQSLGVGGLRRAKANPFVLRLQRELRAARKLILEHYTGIDKYRPNDIVNDAGHTLPKGQKSDRKKLAHILQGAESEILRASMEFVADICLLAHDGFVARSQVDTAALQAHVLQRTGFSVSFSQVQL